MEGVSSPTDQQNLVSRFLEIAVGETADTARRCLEATGWKLEEALQLFYVESEGGLAPPSTYSPPPSTYSPPDPPYSPLNDANPSDPGKELVDKSVGQDPDDDIRPPLPVKREILYDNPILHGHGFSGAPGVGSSSFSTHTVVPFRNFGEERNSRVWDAADRSSSSVADKPQNNLASLYRPPFELMFQGSFEKAKDNAKMQNKWLLINLQSNKEFSSHMLNRDTWANEAVAQTIKTNFVFWQVYDDSEEGSKVCNYYKLYSIPVILVIDPITGQKMHSRSGMVQPEVLLEDLLPFMDGSPSAHHVSFSHKRPRESSQAPTSHVQSTPDENNEDEELQRALAASMENFKEISEGDLSDPDGPAEEKVKMPAYLPLPEEPKGVDRGLLCKVGVRLPDGRRVQRNFLRTDPVQLLWSFCYSALKEDARPFRLTQAIPGASKSLDYDAKSTFEESGLANTMVSVTWE